MLKCCARTLLWVLAIPAFLSSQSGRPYLQRLAGIASEDGVVALDGNTVSAFSTGNVRLQDVKSLQWRLAGKKDGAVSMKVDESGPREPETPLSISAAHSLALCDRLNQVDTSAIDHSLRLSLPAGAKVKSLVHLRDDLSLVVYSVSDRTVTYDIRVGVVRRDPPTKYSLIATDLVTDSGNFCGIQQGDGAVFFVFANEPSGSSDFSSVYAYSAGGRSTDGDNEESDRPNSRAAVSLMVPISLRPVPAQK